MPANTFSTGRDCQLVVIGPAGSGGQAGSRVDLTHVTGFESKQVTHQIRVDRLDGLQLAAELPRGWQGAFELERGARRRTTSLRVWSRPGLRTGGCWGARFTSTCRRAMEA